MLHRNPINLYALQHVSEMCRDHDKSLEILTPREQKDGTCSIDVLETMKDGVGVDTSSSSS